MSLPVRLKDVVEALDEGNDECSHYLDKRTGEIFLITNEDMSAAEEDELVSDYPEWQQESILKAREILESNDLLKLPGRFDIHEYSIMERFGQQYEDGRTSAELLRSIRGQGAFRRFKDTLYDLGIQDEWYEFRRKEFEEIAVEWLEDEQIAYSRENEIAAAADGVM
ncbi:MAG TPA: UPF0158 family protein [Pyrinomonadaceae bacterium]|jgi:Uncharacterised protein family (UPF0158).|nr:UPF0158 family protein [Pyrinomonadaceae bacterium]